MGKKICVEKKENKEIRVKNQINNEIRRNGDAFSHLLCELTPFFFLSECLRVVGMSRRQPDDVWRNPSCWSLAKKIFFSFFLSFDHCYFFISKRRIHFFFLLVYFVLISFLTLLLLFFFCFFGFSLREKKIQ